MDILSELQTIFRKYLADDGIILKPETTAADIDGWDSLTHVGLVLTVESHYKMRFDTSEISNMENVGKLAELIASKI